MNIPGLYDRLVQVAAQSPSNKRKVGAIIASGDPVSGFKVHSEGFNYNLRGIDCPCEDDFGITMEDVIHAEQDCLNNLRQITKAFLKSDLTMYVTREPCTSCLAALKRAGIPHVVMRKSLAGEHEAITERTTAIMPDTFKEGTMVEIRNERVAAPHDINDTLKQRGSVYGAFEDNAALTQDIMYVVGEMAKKTGRVLKHYEKEALHMIAHKVSRIVVGQKTKKDNWHDIAGYAKLAEDLTEDQ